MTELANFNGWLAFYKCRFMTLSQMLQEMVDDQLYACSVLTELQDFALPLGDDVTSDYVRRHQCYEDHAAVVTVLDKEIERDMEELQKVAEQIHLFEKMIVTKFSGYQESDESVDPDKYMEQDSEEFVYPDKNMEQDSEESDLDEKIRLIKLIIQKK